MVLGDNKQGQYLISPQTIIIIDPRDVPFLIVLVRYGWASLAKNDCAINIIWLSESSHSQVMKIEICDIIIRIIIALKTAGK